MSHRASPLPIETADFQNPNSGHAMTLVMYGSGHFDVACHDGDDYYPAATDDDEQDARVYAQAVRHCDTFKQACCILARQHGVTDLAGY